MARGFDRPVEKFQLRVWGLNGHIALGLRVTKVGGSVCPAEGDVRLSDDMCNSACYSPSFCATIAPTTAGLALPPVDLSTCPVNQPASLGLTLAFST